MTRGKRMESGTVRTTSYSPGQSNMVTLQRMIIRPPPLLSHLHHTLLTSVYTASLRLGHQPRFSLCKISSEVRLLPGRLQCVAVVCKGSAEIWNISCVRSGMHDPFTLVYAASWFGPVCLWLRVIRGLQYQKISHVKALCCLNHWLTGDTVRVTMKACRTQ